MESTQDSTRTLRGLQPTVKEAKAVYVSAMKRDIAMAALALGGPKATTIAVTGGGFDGNHCDGIGRISFLDADGQAISNFEPNYYTESQLPAEKLMGQISSLATEIQLAEHPRGWDWSLDINAHLLQLDYSRPRPSQP